MHKKEMVIGDPNHFPQRITTTYSILNLCSHFPPSSLEEPPIPQNTTVLQNEVQENKTSIITNLTQLCNIERETIILLITKDFSRELRNRPDLKLVNFVLPMQMGTWP